MLFQNPLMLAGVGAAVVPVVIHLLSRARYRTVDWGAMMFLAPVSSSQQRIGRLRQWVLLAVRCAIVLLLALAMARPVWQGGDPLAGPRAVAIVLDCSGSMGFSEAGRTRFDIARDAAAQLISGLGPGDRGALFFAGALKPEQGPGLVDDVNRLSADLAGARVHPMAADLPSAISDAARVLSAEAAARSRVIYVVADQQALSWRDADRARSNGCRVVLVPVGSRRSENLAVTAVGLADPPAIRGQPVEVTVTVRNGSREPAGNVPIELRVGERTLAATKVDLAAGSSAVAGVRMTFPLSGSQVVRASIADGSRRSMNGLTIDDSCSLAVDVSEPLRVLVVSGDERPQPLRSESSFLQLALAPYATSAGATDEDMARVDVTPVEQWVSLDLGGYQVLVLANVPRLSEAQVRRVEQFVFGGGGLLVAPGALVDVRSYGQSLYRGGAGILPVALREPTDASGAAATRLLGIDLAHPVFAFLRGQPDPIPSATVGRFFPVTDVPAGVAVRASYASGEPFMIESQWGRGRVILLTTPVDADWSSLPMSSFYLPFMQSMTRHLSGGGVVDRNLSPGDDLIAHVGELIERGAAVVEDPAGRSTPAAVSRVAGAGTEIRHRGRTHLPGEYRVTYHSGDSSYALNYVVQPTGAESDLTPLDDQQWGRLVDRLSAERAEDGRDALARSVSGASHSAELWLPLLGLVIVIALSELFLERLWFGRMTA